MVNLLWQGVKTHLSITLKPKVVLGQEALDSTFIRFNLTLIINAKEYKVIMFYIILKYSKIYLFLLICGR